MTNTQIDIYIRNMQPIYSSKKSVIYRGFLKNNMVAVKHIPKRYCKTIDNISVEVNTLQKLQSSKHVVRYIDIIENDMDIYIIMEWINGMNIREYVNQLDKPLKEQTIKEIIYPLVETLSTINSLNLIYGDVKPDNIMIQSSGDIKLIDFGCTRTIGTINRTYLGTPMYFSPEMFDQVCLPQYDVWGIGIIIYYLACGKHPFVRTLPVDLNDLKNMVQNKSLLFDDPIWEEWSKEGKDLIRQLLEKDPFMRTNIGSVVRSEWFDMVSRLD